MRWESWEARVRFYINKYRFKSGRPQFVTQPFLLPFLYSYLFRIDIIATEINIKCYIDSRPALCRREIVASINHAKKFSLKSLTISDYHFINPIKNPTKKNRKSKKSNKYIWKFTSGHQYLCQKIKLLLSFITTSVN